MKLLTKELRKQFPKLGETDGMDKSKIQVIAKFFTPWTNWTWYATEGQFDFLVLVCYNKDGELIREQGSNMADDEKEALCGLWESIPKRPLPFSCEENDLRNFMQEQIYSRNTETKEYLGGEKPNLGYFSLSELESIQGPAGLRIERDLHFSATLGEVMEGKRR